MDNDTLQSVEMQYEVYQVPFCRPFKCQLTPGRFTNGTRVSNTLWDCVPGDCKVYVTIFLGLIVMLGAITVTFNCLILGINLASKTRRMRKRNPIMKNYSVYVVSLAVADLLVGVAVLPLCIMNLYLEFNSNFERNSKRNQWEDWRNTNIIEEEDLGLQHPQARINIVSSGVQDLTTIAMHNHTAVQEETIDFTEGTAVRVALGTFTHLTLFVSIYTLITASADRLYAASHSVHLTSSQFLRRTSQQKRTNWLKQMTYSLKRSTVAVFIVWICGIIFALLPVAMRKTFYFRHVGHIFAAMTSTDNYVTGVRWYLFTLVIPLVGMWILNLMICCTLWKRKRQLGLKRQKSLHYKSHLTSPTEKFDSGMPSTSDSVFEKETKSPVVKKYPASRWNKGSFGGEDSTYNLKAHSLYRKKASNQSGGRITSSSFRSFESKSSGLRRKVSSLRRAKELLKRQSYEANITKTLCIVVVAFTLAVLPLIITLCTITLDDNGTKERLNKEVTALSCSLFLLFSNSFVNCVIYGARMRDFRKSLCQILHNFMDKIKNMLCCCYQRANDNISSEIVNGVFLVTKQQRDQKSPYMKKLSKHTTFFPSSRSASKLSNISTLENRSNVVKSESNLPPPITKLLIENAPSDQGNCNGHNQKPRTLSSRYRSNPELTLSYEELDKQRNSFAENEECGGSDLVVPAIWRTSSFIESEKHQRATLTNIGVEAVKTCQGDDNIAIKSRSKCAALKNGNAEKPEDSPTIRTCKTPRDHDLDKSKIKDVWRDDRNESVDGNSINTGGSNHQYTSDFTLGIDFSDFS